jgi:hypothetical protein
MCGIISHLLNFTTGSWYAVIPSWTQKGTVGIRPIKVNINLIILGLRGRRHRYLMSRLSLQVFYLWRHVLSRAQPFILWWWNLEIIFALFNRNSPFIGAALSSNSNGTRSVYSRKNPKSSLQYIVRCLWSPNTRNLLQQIRHIQ